MPAIDPNTHVSADEIASEVWADESPAAAAPTWRDEHDSLGVVRVPADRRWGAQTQRSLHHFDIGSELMPLEVCHAYGHIKKAAALANRACGVLDDVRTAAIVAASEEVIAGQWDEHFPLSVFQTGSGTQTNANVNEVIAHRANELLVAGGEPRSRVDPLDHVNRSQSTNDTFVTAMHIAAYLSMHDVLLPSLRFLARALGDKSAMWADVMKVGRTHLMDATLLTVGQEWSGYASAVEASADDVESASRGLLPVAMGGTAVGTGTNTPDGFVDLALMELRASTDLELTRAANPFAAQSTLDPLVRSHGAMKSAAVTLYKIANDIRWLASGPRQGMQELRIPANEPGSTVMPGKVNPTQAEALLMVCITVIGQDTIVTMAGAEGNFELNAFRPIVISNHLRSARLLADACRSFRVHLIEGAELNRATIDSNVSRAVMTIASLTPAIGHERAAEIVRHAIEHDLPAREAAQQLGVEDELLRNAFGP